MHQHEERTVVPLYVIVDMQPRWQPARSIVFQVEQVIREAARTKSPVIVLEFKSESGKEHSRTFKRLLDLMDQLGVIYIRTFKETPSGHREIANVIARTGWDHREINYCGVKTHQCVSHTVGRSREVFPNSRHNVLAYACNDTNGNDWNRFPGGPNVVVIHRAKKGQSNV